MVYSYSPILPRRTPLVDTQHGGIVLKQAGVTQRHFFQVIPHTAGNKGSLPQDFHAHRIVLSDHSIPGSWPGNVEYHFFISFQLSYGRIVADPYRLL